MSINTLAHQSQAEQASPQLMFTAQQLCNEVCTYYAQLRCDQLPSLTQHIPAQFGRVQREVLQIVQLRKNMEKALELQELQSQHFPTVLSLVQLSKKQEQSIAEMSEHIKLMQNRSMSEFLDGLLKHRSERTIKQSQIIEKGHQLVLQLKDFKRTFHLNHIQHTPAQQEMQTEAQDWQHEELFQQVMRSQQRKWDLAKFIYSIKLNQLNLRSQLLQERQNAHIDFQRANNELIDTLLREKERDKNLRKKDNEKFGEIIKQRDEIDLENENLSHSEKSLLPHFQSQLLRVKAKLREQQSRHEMDQQRWQKKNEELAKELEQTLTQSKAIEVSFLEKELLFRDKIDQMKRSLQENADNRRIAEGSLRSSKAEAQIELQRVKSKNKHLEHQNNQLTAKNQHLQSQYNQLILKSSQLNHIKGELAQKFDKTAKKAQQLEAKLEELKNNLTVKDEELRNMQAALKSLKTEKQHCQVQILQLENNLNTHREYVRQYEEKITLLESELTQNFILHNQERANLLLELDQKDKSIEELSRQMALMQQRERQRPELIKIAVDSSISASLLQCLRNEIAGELARGQKAKLQLIDAFVGRMESIV